MAGASAQEAAASLHVPASLPDLVARQLKARDLCRLACWSRELRARTYLEWLACRGALQSSLV